MSPVGTIEDEGFFPVVPTGLNYFMTLCPSNKLLGYFHFVPDGTFQITSKKK